MGIRSPSADLPSQMAVQIFMGALRSDMPSHFYTKFSLLTQYSHMYLVSDAEQKVAEDIYMYTNDFGVSSFCVAYVNFVFANIASQSELNFRLSGPAEIDCTSIVTHCPRPVHLCSCPLRHKRGNCARADVQLCLSESFHFQLCS